MQHVFSRLFFCHYILKPSCYYCTYANFNRQGDFTLGDYWGVENHYPEFDDDKRVSLVMISTQKAQEIWKKINSDITFFEIKKEECIQPNLIGPSKAAERRDDFWEQYYKHGLRYAGEFVGLLNPKGIRGFILKIQIHCVKLTGSLISKAVRKFH